MFIEVDRTRHVGLTCVVAGSPCFVAFREKGQWAYRSDLPGRNLDWRLEIHRGIKSRIAFSEALFNGRENLHQ